MKSIKLTTEESLKERLTTLLGKAETLEDIEYLEQKLSTTKSINRRTVHGRVLIHELKVRASEIIKEKGILPF